MRNHIRTNRYPKCVCVALLKRLKDAVYSCVSFREQLYFPVLSREPYLCHTVFKVCVCVCARHSLKDGITPVFLCFNEQYCPLAIVLSFPENSIACRHLCYLFQRTVLPVGFCAIFSREQFPSSAFVKEKV